MPFIQSVCTKNDMIIQKLRVMLYENKTVQIKRFKEIEIVEFEIEIVLLCFSKICDCFSSLQQHVRIGFSLPFHFSLILLYVLYI